MMSNIRKLNEEGLRYFADYLLEHYKKEIDVSKLPIFLLNDDDYSEELAVQKQLKEVNCNNRFELGKHYYNYLHQDLTQDELDGQGLWSWLALFHFNLLFARTFLRLEYYIPLGAPKTGVVNQKFINSPKTFSYDNFSWQNPLEYRHAIKGYFHFYKTFGDSSVILCSSSGMTYHGDVAEQIGGILWLKQYKIILDLFKSLYWHAETQSFKKANGRGALTSNAGSKGYLGGLRRARAVIDALMDIHNFEKLKKTSHLIALMGDEFKTQVGEGN
jgi:hypothetical protein